MYYKIGKKTTKMTEEKFKEYINKENLNALYVYDGLIYFNDDKGVTKAKIDKTQEE